MSKQSDLVNIAQGDTITVDHANGRVGIGTTSPDHRLDVYVPGGGRIARFINGSSGGISSNTHGELIVESGEINLGIQLLGTATSNQKILFGDPDSTGSGQLVYDHTSNYMSFVTNTAERMRINSSGNVGIGTTSIPVGSRLRVSSTDAAAIGLINGASYGIRFGSISGVGGLIEGVDVGGVSSYQPLVVGGSNILLSTNGSERMRIDSSGYLLIGCTGSFGTTGNQGLRPGSAGQLILGANSGGLYHQVPGTIYYLVSTAGGSTSDVNLKTNVATLEGALDKVCALRGVSFEFIEEQMSDPDNGQQIGVIAQEVEAQYPEAVVTGPDGIKSVRYEKLVAPLIEAIKEQRAVIEALEARMAVLEGGSA